MSRKPFLVELFERVDNFIYGEPQHLGIYLERELMPELSKEEQLKIKLAQKSDWWPYIPETQLLSPPWEHKEPSILGEVLCKLGFHNYENLEGISADLKIIHEYAQCVRCGDTITTKKYPNPYFNRE